MIRDTLDSAFGVSIKKQWDKIFVAVDIHSTAIVPNYEAGNIPTEFYPFAKETLKLLTELKTVSLILYTCSHPHEIEEYLKFFTCNGIDFDYVNENPEVKTDTAGYGNYDSKFYFNVLLEDKAGFVPGRDWEMLYDYLKGTETPDPTRLGFSFRSTDSTYTLTDATAQYYVRLSEDKTADGYLLQMSRGAFWMPSCTFVRTNYEMSVAIKTWMLAEEIKTINRFK